MHSFLNDEASQEILVANGIVKIIVDCLERNLSSTVPLTESHPYVRFKRKKCNNTDNELNKFKKRSKTDLKQTDVSNFYNSN